MSTPTMRAPLDPSHVGHNPVRDDTKLAPTEDLDREPDGVPHRVVGLTALFAVMFAMLIGFMFLMGSTVTKIAAIIIAVMAIPVLVGRLGSHAATERDRVHPSR
ncbi:MAG TPA: hypothetical protein VM513_31615 [Kofleriaceae bacterium]|jgi:hypothetical protein|nr:hypothetical protein [Kofleriaceae bacterium]